MKFAAIGAFFAAVIGKTTICKIDLVEQFAETEHDPEHKLLNANSEPHSITWAVFCLPLI